MLSHIITSMGNMLDGVIFGYLLPEIPPKYIMPRPYHTIYELDLEIGKWQKEFEKLQLTESEVGQLLYQFERIDLDDSGGISYGEFVKFLRLNNNEFAGRAFDAFDHDRSGEIDFYEFCFSVWNYCTMSPGTLVTFAFGTYANGINGQLCAKDIKTILTEFYGADYSKNQTAIVLERDFNVLLRDKFDEVRQDDFKAFCKSHPLLLWPVFRLQERLQRKVLGLSFWRDVAHRRYVIGDGDKYIEIGQLLNVQLHELDRLEYVHMHTKPGLQNNEKVYGGDQGTLATNAHDDQKKKLKGKVFTKQNRPNISGYLFTTQTYVRNTVTRDPAVIPQDSFAEKFHTSFVKRHWRPPKMAKKGHVAGEEDLNLSPLEQAGQGVGFVKYAAPRPHEVELTNDAKKALRHGQKLARERSQQGVHRPQGSSPTFAPSKEDLAEGKLLITDARAEGVFSPDKHAREVMGSESRDFGVGRITSRQPSQQLADEMSPQTRTQSAGVKSTRSTSRPVSGRIQTERSSGSAASQRFTTRSNGTPPGSRSPSRQASARSFKLNDTKMNSARNLGQVSPLSLSPVKSSGLNSQNNSLRMPGALPPIRDKAASVKDLQEIGRFKVDTYRSTAGEYHSLSKANDHLSASNGSSSSPLAQLSRETSKRKFEREMSNFKLKTPVSRSTSTRIVPM